MFEQEFVELHFIKRPSLEFKPGEIKLWRKIINYLDFTDCDRIVIDSQTIEFQRNRENYLLSLDEYAIFVNYLFVSPLDNPGSMN